MDGGGAIGGVDDRRVDLREHEDVLCRGMALVFKGPVYWTANLTETGLDWTEKWTGLQSQSRPVLDQSSLQSKGFQIFTRPV